MDKLWYIQTMKYLVIKRYKLPSLKKTQKNLKCILLSERSQSEKDTYCLIHTIWHFGNGKTMKTVKYHSYRSLALETNEQAEYREFLGW